MDRKPNPQSRSQTGAPKRAQLSTPPYNPGLQKLVDGKQAWAVPLDEDAKAKGFLGWHQRGYLPHYDAPWVTQFVTLRLVDSLPASRRGEWEHLLRSDESRASSLAGAPTCSRLAGDDNPQSRSQTGAPLKNSEAGRERRRKLEAYLDRGLGECWLGRPEVAALAEGALRFFDGQRYGLAAWVVMPNHLHLLVDVWEVPLAELVKSWKDFVAKQANKLLGRSGGFWEREYLDTVIEDEQHRSTAVRYIENNPVKAGLVREAKAWLWSSARFRDEFGRLRSADVSSALGQRQPGSAKLNPKRSLFGIRTRKAGHRPALRGRSADVSSAYSKQPPEPNAPHTKRDPSHSPLPQSRSQTGAPAPEHRPFSHLRPVRGANTFKA